MITFLSIVYIVVCFFLIAVVLLQSGRGGGLGSSFGGGGGAGQQIFGGAGAGNLLTRLTAVFAFTFMVLSAVLSYLSTGGEQALDRAARDTAAPVVAEELEAPADAESDDAEQAAGEGIELDADIEVAEDAEGEIVVEEAAEEAPVDAAESPSAAPAGADGAEAEQAPTEPADAETE